MQMNLVYAVHGADPEVRQAIADQLLTPAECAEKLGKSPSTFHLWSTKADFPVPFKGYQGKVGLRPLYWWPDIDAWARENGKAQNLKG